MLRVFAVMFRSIFTTIALIFGALFVITTVLVILLLNVDHTLLSAGAYKHALAESNFYEQFPSLVSEQFSLIEAFVTDPCARNPLGCAIDGASPELQACLENAIGARAVEEIGAYKRAATEEEATNAQPCLDQFGSAPSPGPVEGAAGENPLANASAEVQACAQKALGAEAYTAIQSGARPPTDAEMQLIAPCLGNAPSPSGSGQSGIPNSFLNNLSPEDWKAVLSLLFPPADLQKMTEATLDQYFAYLNGSADSVSVPLVALKDRLSGQPGKDLIPLLIKAQPPCTDEEAARINAGDIKSADGSILICAATGDTLAKLTPALESQLADAVSTMRDEAVLIKKPISTAAPPKDTGLFSGDAPTVIHRMQLAIRLSPLLSMILLLLATLFGVRSLNGWVRWWSILIFLTGLVSLAVGLVIPSFVDWLWKHYAVIRIPLPFSSSNLVPLAYGVAHSVTLDFVKWLDLESVIPILLGMWGMFGKFGEGKAAPPKPMASAPRPPAPTPGPNP